jgi:hypothetical protein
MGEKRMDGDNNNVRVAHTEEKLRKVFKSTLE